MLKSLGIATTIGLVFGFVLVWWVAPDKSSGSVFLVILSVIICAAVGIIFERIFSGKQIDR
ncbi:hypothetical protein ACU8MX_22385 [Rhizobium leguminosarum]